MRLFVDVLMILFVYATLVYCSELSLRCLYKSHKPNKPTSSTSLTRYRSLRSQLRPVAYRATNSLLKINALQNAILAQKSLRPRLQTAAQVLYAPVFVSLD
jgi:hypothetical protein